MNLFTTRQFSTYITECRSQWIHEELANWCAAYNRLVIWPAREEVNWGAYIWEEASTFVLMHAHTSCIASYPGATKTKRNLLTNYL
ncbi:hypothetical protein PR048_016518 [Dryococelus australis]|uniref:Transposase n=1 Tax=Dryococelus australis TaxID=614101 RepID=A0ABQ9HK47_9NEOP|nr:hypothetical protein PR048_016518 [Dryococelus australis]